MKWLKPYKDIQIAYDKDTRELEENAGGVVVFWNDYDRMIAIVEKFDNGYCMAEYKCTEAHRPEDGAEWIEHDIGCPYHEEWKP